EDGDAGVRALVLDETGKQGEMIVLNQHAGFVRSLHLLEKCVGKFAVHSGVMLPICGAEGGARVRNVAEGPETLIGKTKIVALFLLLAEPDPLQRVLGVVRRNL